MPTAMPPHPLTFILDLQACQCVSRYRGIGRYSLAFAHAFVSAASNHDVRVFLNGMFPEATADLGAEFATQLPAEKILTWTATGPTAECDPANRSRREDAERGRERFLAAQAPDIVHVGSLFEGFPDSAITSIGECPGGPATAATLYDLIPLIYREHYLDPCGGPDSPMSQYYFRKIGYVRAASLVLAISEATRCEAIDVLGLAPDRVVNISTAADPMFAPIPAAELPEHALRAKLGLARPFVMYTGGPDRRKNIDTLVTAWARLEPAVRRAHQLMVVCALSDGHRAHLAALARSCGLDADELVLPGFVSDADLVALYNLAHAFIFPSWHEGFGLPVLEAMACGTPTLASNTSSLPEVVGRADALFDPRDDRAIAAALHRVLTDQAFRNDLREHGLRRARLFTWDATARRALDAFEASAARQASSLAQG
jgi:glycosyltransferase involved in cell wall biosynthesis